MRTQIQAVSPYVFPILKINTQKTFANPDDIIDFVCDSFAVERYQLNTEKGKRGLIKFTIIRQICFYMIRRYTNLPLKNIGKYFKRDHSTVIHSITCVNNILSTREREYYITLIKIQKELNQIYKIYDREIM